MTATGTAPTPGTRPRPAPGIRLELTETATGWSLVVHADAATTSALRSVGAQVRAAGPVTISVAPNLVPGVPFTIDSVRIAPDVES